MILFEILDFNVRALKERDLKVLDQDNQYRIAWGYLRPVGLAQNYIG